jgi:hypothetical protein
MSDGKVGGYFYGSDKKRQLLEKEGISFTNGIVTNFKNVRSVIIKNDNKL